MSTVFLPVLTCPKMLQLLELVPLFAFFITFRMSGRNIDIGEFHYQLDGLYSATAVLMILTVLQAGILWTWKRKLEKRNLWLLVTVVVFGSATLLFHNPLFVQWKPTIFAWVMGAVLLGSHLFTDRNLVQRITGQQFQLPDIICNRLTYLWSSYFFLNGALNLVVVYHFSQSTWVSYKLWSAMGFTLLMSVITLKIAMPHIRLELDGTSGNPATGETPSPLRPDDKK